MCMCEKRVCNWKEQIGKVANSFILLAFGAWLVLILCPGLFNFVIYNICISFFQLNERMVDFKRSPN